MRGVYVETSVWGMVPPGQDPGLRRPTMEFLRQCEARVFQPYISDVVANEIRQAPQPIQDRILERLSEVNPVLLSLSPEVEVLAQRFIDEGIVPPRRLNDARHVACALVHGLDLLVSWNYRHIANVRKAEAFNAVAVLE